MAAKKPAPTKPATAVTRRNMLKTTAAVLGAGLVTTVVARDAQASGSWGGGGNSGGGNSGGNNGNGRGGRGGRGGGRR